MENHSKEAMMIRRISFLLALGLATSACQPQAPSGEVVEDREVSPIAGAWRVVAVEDVTSEGEVTEIPTHESMVIFTDRYYSIAFSMGDRASLPFAERWAPTDAESLDRFGVMVVNTGIYQITPTTVVTSPLFALTPEFIGGAAEHEYTLEGNLLTLTATSVTSFDDVSLPQTTDDAVRILHLERIG
jgi:hypothetical protein